jgi:hypothetical protein
MTPPVKAKQAPYVRPEPLDPTALRESTARYRAHNDRLQREFDRESASGILLRLEAEDRAIAERRAKRKTKP